MDPKNWSSAGDPPTAEEMGRLGRGRTYRRRDADTLELLDAAGRVVGSMRWPVERERRAEPYNDPRGFTVDPLPDREETLVKLKRVKSYERNADGSWNLHDARGEVVMVMPPLSGWQRLARSAFK